MMEATGNDVALVMSYSGHKSIESLKIYLHPTEKGRILANQRMIAVGDLLGLLREYRERRELTEQDPLMLSA